MASRAASMATMRIRRLKSVWLGVVLVLCLSGALSAQTEEPAETIRIESDLVNLQVSVLGHDPLKPPNFLQQQDFLVFDDGTPQEISFFEAADAPFDLVLVLDLSGSTSNKLKMIRKSAKRFVAACRPADRVAVVSFAENLEIVSPLTSDHKMLSRDIDDIERLSNGTNYWDALRYVFERIVRPGQSSRRTAVVLMTDGVDNALPDVPGSGSITTFEELTNVAEHSDAVLVPIYLDTEKEEVKRKSSPASAYASAREQLARLAEISGTVVRKANKLEDLANIYEQIIRDLGTVYSIGYRPANTNKDGKWHKLGVSLVNRPELSARTRSGYYAGALATTTPK
jgi:VWFA-related protein